MLIHEEKFGLLESSVIKVLKEQPLHNITYHEANTSNKSIKCNKYVSYECTKIKGERF
jgi:hypothetical protein